MALTKRQCAWKQSACDNRQYDINGNLDAYRRNTLPVVNTGAKLVKPAVTLPVQ